MVSEVEVLYHMNDVVLVVAILAMVQEQYHVNKVHSDKVLLLL